MDIPVYNCIVDEDVNDPTGIFAMSFVSDPANESSFIALSEEEIYLNKDSKKQILTGVVLKPEQLIYRNSPKFGEHYIRFSAEQIEKISHKMIIKGIALFNTVHEHRTLLERNHLTELWIVENPQNDKSNALGFKDLPKGTLMCSYKVEDSNYWNSEVMSGNVKGFSLEGFFNQEICMSKLYNNKNNPSMKKKRFVFNKTQRAALSFILSKEMLSDIESVESGDTTGSGEAYIEFTLEDGKIVKVDADGFATMDGEQIPSGEHLLADGSILVVDESGNFVETKEPSATTIDPDEATAAETLKRKQRLAKEKEERAKEKIKLVDLNAIIADLTSKIGKYETKMEEARAEISELKKNIPSSNPVVQTGKGADLSKMSSTEKMAHAASLAMQRRMKK
jgi:hypothetical protein